MTFPQWRNRGKKVRSRDRPTLLCGTCMQNFLLVKVCLVGVLERVRRIDRRGIKGPQG